jgi:LysM repeat protein
LLWLVRRQIHHLRELCCDATVAGLLREDAGAYRETLLETARRFLATRTEPGLGLLGLFEDSNRLLVRLNWLNKPTWRYRRMKRAIVIAIIGLMLVCVLPMARSQPTAAAEDKETPATQRESEQFAQQMKQLEQQMQRLQQQRQLLQQQMQQMNQQMAQLERQRAQFVQDEGGHGVFQTYTVRPGDTLASIAARFSGADASRRKEAIAEIMEANRLTSADQIQVGQKILIPLSADVSERIRDQLAATERRIHDMSWALMEAEHTLNEAPHMIEDAPPHVPHAVAPMAPPIPQLGDVPMVGHVAPEPPAKAAVDADYVVKALQPGTELQIQNNVGSIKVRPGPGRDGAINVKVEVKETAPKQAEEIAKRVLVKITPQDDKVIVGVEIPDDISKEQRDKIHVYFDLMVPSGINVSAAQNIGHIRLSGLGTSNVQARTNVGTIHVQDLQGKVALAVNVGDIEVVVPADVSAKVSASAKIGAIKSDLPLAITSASVMRAGDVHNALGSTATGVLGAGEGKLDLKTNVGSIKIRSASAMPGDAVL